MNWDDPSILSAYLDGELDPAERQAVESALASDPRLSDRLRELAAVRDLVGGLSRPSCPLDLSAAVTRQIGRRRPGQRVLADGPSPSRARVRAAGLVAAASILLTLAVGVLNTPRPRFGPMPGRLAMPAGKSAPSAPLAAERGSVSHQAPAETITTQPRVAVRHVAADASDGDHTKDAVRFRELLDSPNLNKIFIVTDILGGGADREVGQWLETSPRVHSRFGRITVSQGILIDPKHPDEATVFAVVLDDHELGELRRELRKRFPNTLEETAPDPTVVTQLADIGDVFLSQGTAVAALETPGESPSRFAAKRATDRENEDDRDEVPRLTPERRNSAPAPFNNRIAQAPSSIPAEESPAAPPPVRSSVPRENAARGAATKPERNDLSVVLVWVTRTTRHSGP